MGASVKSKKNKCATEREAKAPKTSSVLADLFNL